MTVAEAAITSCVLNDQSLLSRAILEGLNTFSLLIELRATSNPYIGQSLPWSAERLIGLKSHPVSISEPRIRKSDISDQKRVAWRRTEGTLSPFLRKFLYST